MDLQFLDNLCLTVVITSDFYRKSIYYFLPSAELRAIVNIYPLHTIWQICGSVIDRLVTPGGQGLQKGGGSFPGSDQGAIHEERCLWLAGPRLP